ncbi:DNA repair protein [Parabacteroides sp. 52]|uniref:JAB domain-containing protein n=1 Tax=unclassified Parabacteroides TaxID=2649774 RepID=UPI0013D5EDF3|nr:MULTISPECIES: JAB domain-containing protein [unclassified Parabacteroides]MDH6535620.1 DNA repair protein RadC [Parabacteroides sp. PM5-20]NDV56450.1 DNA repair protein [Parabacteroides sp. 52]
MGIYKASEVKLTYKSKVKASERPQIRCSQDIYKLLKDSVFDSDTIEHHESLKVVLLNRAGKVLGFHTVSVGGTSECTADTKIIMQAAILGNANAIILSHNHPSGNMSPSPQDDLLTEKLSKVCKLMGMSLLDHIIVTTENYYSYADEGRI